jgi:Caspase domain.
MAIGIPIIVAVTELNAAFYGDAQAASAAEDASGPNLDAAMVRDSLFAPTGSAGMQQPVVLGSGAVAAHAPATRAALSAALTNAALQLQGPGDTLFFYYIGHGSRLPKLVAGLDECNVLCLTDGFFLDVELVSFWQKFKPGTRVLAIFDSCHASDLAVGSLWKRLLHIVGGLVGARPTTRGGDDVRAGKAALAHSDEIAGWYDAAAAAGGLQPLNVALLSFTACSRNEIISTNKGRTRFSKLLVKRFIDTGGGDRNYDELAGAVITALTASDLHPSLCAYGANDPAFETATRPFTV